MSRRLTFSLTFLLAVSWLCAQEAAKALETRYPATTQPDQIILTWAGNPANSVSIQWRTSTAVASGAVAFLPRSQADNFNPPAPTVVKAQTELLITPNCLNDTLCHHHTVQLTHLKPDTEYLYAIGDGTPGGFGVRRSFRTAPVQSTPFSFVYMGDAQYGFSRWAALQQAAVRNRPEVAFFLMAGDQVTRGNDRDDWDDFLCHASEVFSRKPVMPAVGNHELTPDGFPVMYLDQFDLPRNGPADLDPERVYAFNYGNALFVVLDSNLSPQAQVPWLEQTLATSKATWKFVMFHHPAYSSEPRRDNAKVRETWTPIFDKYHVDLVFQGHDHAYLRTFPLQASKKVASPAEGTIYLVSVSGTKMYEQAQRDYTEVGFVQTQVYSVIDLLPADSKVNDRLVFKTYDLEGNVKDQFAIEKKAAAAGD